MNTHTIDTAMAKRMVEASAIRSASIIGQPGGWSVVLKLGLQERALGAQRSDTPRTWRSLDRAVAYLKNELHIARFDLLDASNHSELVPLAGKSRADASERLRLAHEAAGHDKWFRAQVDLALKEADAPDAQWVSAADAKASWEQKRAELLKRAGSAT
ncbi:hypothetical protein [Rhodoferax sp. UBA5149]|uniref:hypothetical protein n=1 Tax=Rhodoferax sp. UBA5149 TaxID=1947379 RepID=UPI0025F1BB54|nr:hypothetical protein [Rhodoferax sp. UBA5149]